MINKGLTKNINQLEFTVQLSAGIAQLVEHNLAKVGVASSNLVSRSKEYIEPHFLRLFLF